MNDRLFGPARPARWWTWFHPRGKHLGGWAYLFHRLSGLGLTLYLALHLFVLGRLAQGPEAYTAFLALARRPWVKAGELLVVAAAVYHGLNGLRVALFSLGIGLHRQREMFWAAVVLTALAVGALAWRLFL